MSSAPCWRAVPAVTAVAAAALIPSMNPARFRLDPEDGTHIVLLAPASERGQARTSPPASPFGGLFALILAALRPRVAACSPAFAQLIRGRPFSEHQDPTSAGSLPGGPDG